MPTLDDVHRLREAIKTASDIEYIFSKLRSPEWIPLLAQEGFFASPYEPVPEEKGLLFRPWPQSRFLARVANEHLSRKDQETIITTVLEIPETTNVSVHRDFAEAALRLDPDLSSKLVPRVAVWIQSPHTLGLPRELGSLLSHLAKGGQAKAALDLAQSVLTVEEDPRSQELNEDTSTFRNIRQPAARFDLWEYEQILIKNLPDLVDAAGQQAMALLCDMLDRAILLSDRRDDEHRPNDASEVWRPAIEDHTQNFNHGVRDLLVTAVRNSAEQLARRDSAWVERLVTLFDERQQSWYIFQRFALHLLRLFRDTAPNLVRQKLLDRSLFDSSDMRHEYFLLEKDCFALLSDDDQDKVLAWIDQGPLNTQLVKKGWEQFTGQVATKEWEGEYIRAWKRDHLAPLEEYLSPRWKATYADLISEIGRPSHPEFVAYHSGGAWGPSSPIAIEELAKMSVNELVEYLIGWEPSPNRLQGGTSEGLGREITNLVSQNPEKYAADIDLFELVPDPTYARAVISGFSAALRKETKFNWRQVLKFCEWAVTQERDIPGRSDEPFAGADPNWGWTRTAILRLLIEGLASKNSPISFEEREYVWRIIERVAKDPDPTKENEERYLLGGVEKEYRKWGANVHGPDPLTSAINSVRGTAIEAAVQYGSWVRGQIEKPKASSFSAMPELREMLNLHLDTSKEPSLSIRSIYGQRLSWLQVFDPGWVRENRPLIFPREKPEYWHAAWDTYICYCQPYDDLFDQIRDEYAFAVEQIGKHRHTWAMPGAPDVGLAQHLATFYWRGKIACDEGPFSAFYHIADAKLRADVINYFGRSLRQSEAMPRDVADRLKNLWEKRLEAARNKPSVNAEELKQYGWWFSSGKFEDDWSIRQLLEVLRIAKEITPDFMVIERLTDLAKTFPSESIEALRMMVEGDLKGWQILAWRDKAKEIIKSALRNPDTQRRAKDLVNLIGSRGHFDFGELLKETV